jgi:hypothetical protein
MSSLNVLRIPTQWEKNQLARSFVKDLESFSIYDEETNEFRPVICCVCDSVPSGPDWWCLVDVKEAAKLFKRCNLDRSILTGIYPEGLLQQYRAPHTDLESFVLSPATYVNLFGEVLMCTQCYSELLLNYQKKGYQEKIPPPEAAIANAYLIGDAPVQVSVLNPVELSLVSRVRIYCQSWIFFGGCHRHIKGWHTFFKNRSTENVGNLLQLEESGMHGMILVVLCGPFTTTQTALCMAKTGVDPRKVVTAWNWLKQNNFRYQDDVIPNVDDIPLPYYIHQEE